MKYNNKKTDYLIIAFLICFFSIPRANIYLGPIPIYILDIISAFLIIKYRKYNIGGYKKAAVIGLSLILFFLLNQINFLLAYQDILTMGYNTFRYILPLLGLFTFYPKIYETIIKQPQRITSIILYAVTASALIILLSSIPLTRPLLTPLSELSFLYPSFEKQFDKNLGAEDAIRGISLIGVSNISGILVLFGLGIALTFRKKFNSLDKVFVVLSLLGAFATYSRNVFLVIIILLLVTLYVGKLKSQQKILIILMMLITVAQWNYLIVQEQYLNLDRIDNATFDTSDNSSNFQHSLEERVNSYIDPFKDVITNPSMLILGYSINGINTRSNYFIMKGNNPDHSLFGRSFYVYGFVTAVIYLVILFFHIFKTIRFTLKKHLLIYASIPIIFWCLSTHGMISNAHGSAMLLFSFTLLNNESERIHFMTKRKSWAKSY